MTRLEAEHREASKHLRRQEGRGPRSAQVIGMQTLAPTLYELFCCPKLGPPGIHSHIQQVGMEYPLSMLDTGLVPGGNSSEQDKALTSPNSHAKWGEKK